MPYSDRAVFTEYWDLQNGRPTATSISSTPTWSTIPSYLQTPWITALHFKKEPDGSKWDPSPCDARF